MQTEATRAEQSLFSKNAEVRAVQKRLDSLKGEIDRETERLLEAQTKALSANIADVTEQIEKQKQLLGQLTTDVFVKKDELTGTIANLATVQSDLAIVQSELTTIEQKIAEKEVVMDDLVLTISIATSQKDSLLTDIQSLQEQKDTLQINLPIIFDSTTHKQAELEKLQAEYDTLQAKKTNQVRELDAKILAKSQYLANEMKQIESERQNIAVAQKKLEALDLSIRVREAKVSESEDKIIRNSSLLNL